MNRISEISFKSSSFFMIALDSQGKILNTNITSDEEKHENIDKLANGINIGEDYRNVVSNIFKDYPKECSKIIEGIEEVLGEKRQVFSFEYAVGPPESRKWFNLVVNAFLNGSKGAVLTIMDISEQKNLESQLFESKRRYRKILESIPEAVIVHINGKIMYANQACASMLGYNERKDVVGESIFSFIHEEFKAAAEERIKKVQKEFERVPTEEEKLISRDGRIMDVEVTSIYYQYDEYPASLVVMRDITEQKQAKELEKRIEENKRLLNKAYEDEKIKNEFFANISHELRTPINVIMGGLQLLEMILKDGIVEEKRNSAKKYTCMMRQNCYRLLRIISNIIDITKIDTGFFEVHLKNNNIVSIVEDVAMSVSGYIENNMIELEFDTEVEEKIIACDPDKIERIMLNLLSNAVKFTHPGGKIFVNIYDRNDKIAISVKDTGIGIAEDKLDVLFERFRQVNSSLTRNNQGSGIGLSLVKSLVELHSGNISVRSQKGMGTEFIMELPVKVIEGETLKEEKRLQESKIEKISIEFSDIYSLWP